MMLLILVFRTVIVEPLGMESKQFCLVLTSDTVRGAPQSPCICESNLFRSCFLLAGGALTNVASQKQLLDMRMQKLCVNC